MNKDSFLALATKLRELRQRSPLLWRLGREGNTIFICDPTFSLSWWLFIGTVDEILVLPLPQLSEHIQHLERARPMIWFPPSQWENGIGGSEIEKYHEG
jgi:hypothetical protein